MHKVVLTGGPCSGKTTLAEELATLGFAVAPEAALQVIEALAQELGPEPARAWRAAHPDRFQRRIAELQLELEQAAERAGARWVVCDRGIPDGIAYCRYYGIAPPPRVAAAAAAAHYDAVLLLETLTDFRPRRETGRTDDRATSLRLAELIHAVYEELGYQPFRVAAVPVDERLEQARRLLFPG